MEIYENWIIFIFGFFLSFNHVLAKPIIIDKIAAIVNNDIILESEINNMLSKTDIINKNISQKLLNSSKLRHQILDRMVIDHIILQVAYRNNITISDEQLDQTINNIATQNNMSIHQLKDHLIVNNIDYNEYCEQIRKEMLIDKVRSYEVLNHINIIPQEIESTMQHISNQNKNVLEYDLDHIFILLPKKPTKYQLKKSKILADIIIKKSQHGAKFTKLVMNYSSDNQVLRSNYMGWNTLEELPTQFAIHVRKAQKDSTIGPILSEYGLHILKINDIRNRNRKILATEVHVRHILLHTSILITDQQAYDKLKDIAIQINSGRMSFSSAAKKISEDLDSANLGGDLGWHLIDDFDQALIKTLINLKKGEISDPVHSSFGWHLIQLIDTRQIDRTNAVQKAYAYHLLLNRKFNNRVQNWLQEQRASSYVKIIDR